MSDPITGTQSDVTTPRTVPISDLQNQMQMKMADFKARLEANLSQAANAFNMMDEGEEGDDGEALNAFNDSVLKSSILSMNLKMIDPNGQLLSSNKKMGFDPSNPNAFPDIQWRPR